MIWNICLGGLILSCPIQVANDVFLDADSDQILVVPSLSEGPPAAGRRVAISSPEYEGTDVFHTLYLPPDWQKHGPAIPVIFEYTGNYFPQAGCTGQPEHGSLGYCLSGGQYIWVSLPFVSKDGTDNAVTWWGDVRATVQYAKTNVPRIISEYGGDPEAVFLCGFSRGAIAVNYIGLHDDQIASLWTAFISHDHFDGIREWRGTDWGSPLESYRRKALERLKRVSGRPYLVSQNGKSYGAEQYIRAVLPGVGNFSFNYIDARKILGKFPNESAKTGHTDRWVTKPSGARQKVWEWMNRSAGLHRSPK